MTPSDREAVREALEHLQHAEECFEAANVEGLINRLCEQEDKSDGSLWGLITRRIMFATDHMVMARASLSLLDRPAPPVGEVDVLVVRGERADGMRCAHEISIQEIEAASFRFDIIDTVKARLESKYGTGFKWWYQVRRAHPTSVEPAESPWRGMETAPRDGTRVLLYSPDAAEDLAVWTGYWQDDEEIPGGGAWWERPEAAYPVDAEPTRWCPLPPAPAAPEKGGEG